MAIIGAMSAFIDGQVIGKLIRFRQCLLIRKLGVRSIAASIPTQRQSWICRLVGQTRLSSGDTPERYH